MAFHLADDGFQTGTFGQEDRHIADLVHDRAQSFGLGIQVEGGFRDVHRVDVPGLLAQPDLGEPLLFTDPGVVLGSRCRGEPTTVAAHDLVNDEHSRAGVVLTDDVLCKPGSLLGGGPCAQGLFDRYDVVVDRLGKSDNGQPVVVVGEVCGKICGSGVGVVAANGVQYVHPVGDEALGGHLERIVPLVDQTTVDEIGGVGEFDARASDGGAAEPGEDVGVATHLLGDGQVVTLEEPLIAVTVGDDLRLGGHLGVFLDESGDGC